ncbi:MAG TPA: 16S rRNA processing protein RimM [Firmicutes bacterium]|nr:16S rRNA processing protein RimM [Bacillota bacterium]
MFVTVGTISGTFGVRGELKVTPESDHPERRQTLVQMPVFVYLNGIREAYRVLSIEQQRSLWHIRLEGVSTREQAQALIGGKLQIPEHKVLPLPDGEYYIFQILGLQVETEAGEVLGRVAEVLQPGANDVYVVRNEAGRELLIPAIKEVVLNIDLTEQRIIIRPLPGLLDDVGDTDAY